MGVSNNILKGPSKAISGKASDLFSLFTFISNYGISMYTLFYTIIIFQEVYVWGKSFANKG